VNSVHPGFIRTPILDQAKGTEVWDSMTALTPMGRLGEPHEIAAAVAYLASDDASFVTGLELYVTAATSRADSTQSYPFAWMSAASRDRPLGQRSAAHGGEVAAIIQMAMLGELPASTLRDAVLAYPTMAEGLNQLFASWTDYAGSSARPTGRLQWVVSDKDALASKRTFA
jgi:hypothetical protein